MQKIEPVVTFRTGVAGARFIVCLSGAMDAFDPSEQYSRVYCLDERPPDLWAFEEYDFLIPSVCVWRNPANPNKRIFVGLSENGEVVFLFSKQPQERIRDAGLQPESSKGYGYLNDIQQIGDHLYACGFSGQVYRRLGDNNWVHMDEGILQAPWMTSGQYLVEAINGPHERAIYIAGSLKSRGWPPRADFWDGQCWHQLTLPRSAGSIGNIYVESEERIWMCGGKGTLLMGNATDGFRTMNPLGARQLLLSVTKFQDRLYLGSNLGLFRFNPAAQRPLFHPVRTPLQPDIADANIVEAVDDVLWSMGTKDIVRYDGTKWERFNHPNNPPIGAPESASAQ